MCEIFVNDSNLSVFVGDMNCNPLINRNLCDVCDVFGLKNIIKEPTCFKADIPTLVDVFLTNKPRSFSGVINTDIGSSHFHNFIGVASKMFAPLFPKRKLVYRSMKHFCDDLFQNDLENVPFHVCNIFEDIDDIYWAQNNLFMSVLNEHAPLKVKCINKPQVPYMNSELRKAMNNRNMWRGKHFRNKKDKYARSMYVKWRNKVVKLRKISIKNYFDWRCNKKHFTRGTSTKRFVRFYQINLHPATVKSSSVIMEISYPIPHMLLIYLTCIIRLSLHIVAFPMGLTVLPLKMLYWNMHCMKA